MRAIIILVVAAVIGFFGYQMGLNGRSFGDAVGVVTGATQKAEAAAVAKAEEEAAAAAAAAEEAAAAAEAEAAAAAAEAEAAAAAAAAEAEAAAAEAAAAVEAEAVEAEADAAASDSPMAAAAELLTTDGFDADKVKEMIDGSDLSAVQKTALGAAVDAAKDNPALLEATLTRLRDALGL